VVLPEAPKVDEEKPGEIVVPKPVDPNPKPTPAPSLERIVDDFMDTQIAGLNAGMTAYATLGDLNKATNKIVCTIKVGTTTVSEVALGIKGTILAAVSSETAKTYLTKITMGQGTLQLGEPLDAEVILNFVRGAALKDGAGNPVSGTTTIDKLVGTTITATVYDKNGYSYNYEITFVNA
ncbi:MAG: hypothetical protein RRY97_07135, partial [Oscillibacter sp.]